MSRNRQNYRKIDRISSPASVLRLRRRQTQIRNEHIKAKKSEYPHLQGSWFPDVSQDSKILGVDLLIGADYLWSFQEGRTIRGEPNDPVAIETRLGWVLSGPLRGFCEDSQIIVNFVGHDLSRNGEN